jgi:hypothetical protein
VSKFLSRKNGVLYHCIPVAPVGEFILPSDNYGATIPEDVRRKLNMPPNEQTPLIFGATHITKAMAFGLDAGFQDKIFNCSIEGSDGEMVLGCDRKKMMSRVRDITVYEIPDKDFATLEYAERQCVSTKLIPFSSAKIAYQAKNAEDLMRGGLQILAFNETLKELHGSEVLDRIEREHGDKFYQVLGEMVREGKIIWENKERNINPNTLLANKIGVELKPIRPTVNKKNTNTFKK